MKKKKIKRFYYYLITTILIFFCAFFLFNIYSQKTSKKIEKISKTYFEKEVYNYLNNISRKIIIDDILHIYKNDDGEILYVDYNMTNTYIILSKVTKNIKNELNKKEFVILRLPFLIGSNNVFFSNLGPQITVKINFIDSLLTNVYSKITNYGMNNALVESYIKITITGRIITPVGSSEQKVDYNMLIASKVINGRIPLYYGGLINTSSNILDIPIND
jgi:sporulation protein YunB